MLIHRAWDLPLSPAGDTLRCKRSLQPCSWVLDPEIPQLHHGIVKSRAKQTASLIFLRLADLLGMKGIWNIPVAPSMV